MKFVLNGRTFDTVAALKVATYRAGLSWGSRTEGTLYRTSSGVFFTHERETRLPDRGKPIMFDRAAEVSAERAVMWIAANGAAVIDATGLTLPASA